MLELAHLVMPGADRLIGALDDGATKLMAVAAFDGDPAPIENDQGFIDLIARLTAACPAAMEAAGWA